MSNGVKKRSMFRRGRSDVGRFYDAQFPQHEWDGSRPVSWPLSFRPAVNPER